MSATASISATDVAKGLSIFEIDESLAALEAAEDEAEADNGELSESIKAALATYAEAFGYKVDRIADFLKAQKAEAEIAQREGERFQARHKAAENREKCLKQMLVWFMLTRNVQKLRGELNTIKIRSACRPTVLRHWWSRRPPTSRPASSEPASRSLGRSGSRSWKRCPKVHYASAW